MRILFFLIELFLIVILSITYLEYKESIFEKFIIEFLKEKDITFKKISFKDIDKFEFFDIYYKKYPISKKIDLDIDYIYLFKGFLGFDDIKIKNLNINNILKIERKKESSSFYIPIFIKNLYLTANYKEKESFYIDLDIKNIKILKYTDANIKKLSIYSDFFKIASNGKIVKNSIYLNGKIFLNYEKLKRYDKKINWQNIKYLTFNSKYKDNKIDFKIFSDIKNIYKNIDIKSIYIGEYSIDKKVLKSTLTSKAFYKNIIFDIKSDIKYKKSFIYKADIDILNIPNFNNLLKKEALKRVFVKIDGDKKGFKFKIFNNFLNGKGELSFKNFNIKFYTKNIFLKDIFSKIGFKDGYFYINLNGNLKRKIFNYKIVSNIVNIDGSLNRRSTLLNIDIPENSIIKIKDIEVKKLFPIYAKIDFDKKVVGKIYNDYIKSNFTYLNKNIDISSTFNDTKIKINGNIDKNLKISIDIESLNSLYKKILKFSKLPKLASFDAKIALDIDYNIKNSSYFGKIKIPWAFYEYKKYHYLAITFFQSTFKGDLNRFIINYYALTVPNHGFYATKNSILKIYKDKIEIEEFWIEDKIKIYGYYNFFENGKIYLITKNYRYSSIEGVANFDANILTFIDKNRFDIEGDININNGKIFYNPKRVKSVEDEDIIIVDKEEEEKNSFFKNNLFLNIHIFTKKKILYETDDLKAEILADFTIFKEYQKDLELLGKLTIDNGVYKFQNKTFLIKKSEIYFYGPPKNPFLDIYAIYEKDQYLITIHITQYLKNPLILFDSEPYLSQNDILALILFDSKLSSLLFKTASGDKFAGMLSNFFLKDLVRSFGLNLDKFSLITSQNRIGFEIGKKIADKITILYKNDQISSIIIRYNINRHLQSEVLISPNSNSIDLFYKIEK